MRKNKNNSKKLKNIVDNTEHLRNKEVPDWLQEFAQEQIDKRNNAELRILSSLQKYSIIYGFSFIYQQPIEIDEDHHYIIDFIIFFNNQKPIVLECDGFHHLKGEQRVKDDLRDFLIRKHLGYDIERIYSAKINSKRDANIVIAQLMGKYKQTDYFIH